MNKKTFFLNKKTLSKKTLLKIPLVLLILLFLSLSLFNPQNLVDSIGQAYQFTAQEPENKHYSTDESRYLKVYYLMKKGHPYYQAHYLAFKNVQGKESEVIWTKDFWGWRLPLPFYLWQWLTSSAKGILNLFILMAGLTLTAGWLIAKKLTKSKLALLAPLMLLPYFLQPITTSAFMFLTWWAMFWFVFGLTSFFYQKAKLAAIFFSLSVLSREHLIIPLMAMLFLAWLFKKKKTIFFIPLLIFLLMLIFHIQQVSSQVNLETTASPLARLSMLKPKVVLATLAFSTNHYWLVDFRPSLIWLGLATFGLGWQLLAGKEKYQTLISLASFWPLFLAIGFMGKSIWEDYWGAMYVPLAAIFSTAALTIFSNSRYSSQSRTNQL